MALWPVSMGILSARALFNKTFNADETFKNFDGQEYYTWRAIRRQNINNLVKDMVQIFLYLVLVTLAGPDQHQLGRDYSTQARDELGHYGIAYHCAELAFWVGMLASSLIVLLFSPLLMVSLSFSSQ